MWRLFWLLRHSLIPLIFTFNVIKKNTQTKYIRKNENTAKKTTTAATRLAFTDTQIQAHGNPIHRWHVLPVNRHLQKFQSFTKYFHIKLLEKYFARMNHFIYTHTVMMYAYFFWLVVIVCWWSVRVCVFVGDKTRK